jgi:hypothetical protein
MFLSVALVLPWLAVIPLHANVIDNPGFETGNFTGWTATSDWFIYSTGIDGANYSNPGPYDGIYSAESGCKLDTCVSTPTSSLFQDLSTVVGQEYVFSFDYTSDTQVFESASSPNELQALWGTTQVADIVDQPGNDHWLSFSTVVTATSTTTEIQFNAFDSPAFVFIDDVSVTAVPSDTEVPEPSTLPLTGAGAGALVAALYLRRRRTFLSAA